MKNCYWGHAWGQWKETERGEILQPDFYSKKVGAMKSVARYIYQERKCEMCGILQLDKQTTDY